jgi:hypothetical protein
MQRMDRASEAAGARSWAERARQRHAAVLGSTGDRVDGRREPAPKIEAKPSRTPTRGPPRRRANRRRGARPCGSRWRPRSVRRSSRRDSRVLGYSSTPCQISPSLTWYAPQLAKCRPATGALLIRRRLDEQRRRSREAGARLRRREAVRPPPSRSPRPPPRRAPAAPSPRPRCCCRSPGAGARPRAAGSAPDSRPRSCDRAARARPMWPRVGAGSSAARPSACSPPRGPPRSRRSCQRSAAVRTSIAGSGSPRIVVTSGMPGVTSPTTA